MKISTHVVSAFALAAVSATLASCAGTPRASDDAQAASTDRQFVEVSARSYARELANARLALRTTGDPTIAEYARVTESNLTALASNLTRFANDVQMSVPETGSIAADTALAGAHGRRFDRAYLDADRTDRTSLIEAFHREIASGTQHNLAVYALQSLPIVESDLSRVRTSLAYLDNPDQYGELVPIGS